jgi:TolB-like protein
MFKYLLAGFTAVALSACSSYNLPDSPELSASKQWVVMPFSNFSGAAFASEQAEEITASILKEENVNVTLYQVTDVNALDTVLDPSIKVKSAQKWLSKQGADYIVTASVSEWRYKSGLDAEPAVGITLKIVEASTNKVLWQGTGARTGWGRENLAQTGMDVIGEIIEELDLN